MVAEDRYRLCAHNKWLFCWIYLGTLSSLVWWIMPPSLPPWWDYDGRIPPRWALWPFRRDRD